MPRCIISVSPESRSASIYLARRRRSTMRCPVSRATKRSGSGKRRFGRRASTPAMRAPMKVGARPRRTVSTSGSSGMVLDDGKKGGAEFLQLLLADAVDLGHFGEVHRLLLGHFDQRAVGKDDVSRLVSGLGHRGAQRLQRREQIGVSVARGGGEFAGGLALGGEHVLAQFERRLALQRAAAGLGEHEAIAVVVVAGDEARRDQLSEYAAPAVGGAVLADAESLQLVVAVARHRLGRLAREDIGEMAEEEAAFGAQHRAQRLLRLDAPVDQPHRAVADVAMAARRAILAEEAEQHLAAAARAFAQSHEVFELL